MYYRRGGGGLLYVKGGYCINTRGWGQIRVMYYKNGGSVLRGGGLYYRGTEYLD